MEANAASANGTLDRTVNFIVDSPLKTLKNDRRVPEGEDNDKLTSLSRRARYMDAVDAPCNGRLRAA
jgi:hypothetical protein